jgi:hypothetical protein
MYQRVAQCCLRVLQVLCRASRILRDEASYEGRVRFNRPVTGAAVKLPRDMQRVRETLFIYSAAS